MEVLHGSHVAWCTAGTMKMFCIRKNICFHRKKNLLFLPCNMAAVQNLYSYIYVGAKVQTRELGFCIIKSANSILRQGNKEQYMEQSLNTI